MARSLRSIKGRSLDGQRANSSSKKTAGCNRHRHIQRSEEWEMSRPYLSKAETIRTRADQPSQIPGPTGKLSNCADQSVPMPFPMHAMQLQRVDLRSCNKIDPGHPRRSSRGRLRRYSWNKAIVALSRPPSCASPQSNTQYLCMMMKFDHAAYTTT